MTNQNIQIEINRATEEMLRHSKYYLQGGRLNRNTAEVLRMMVNAIKCKKYSEASGILGALKLTRADIDLLHYMPTKWLISLQVITYCLQQGGSKMDTVKMDIEEAICNRMGPWVSGFLSNPPPDGRYIPHCKENCVIQDRQQGLGYRLKY